MFSKLALFTAASMALFVAAAPAIDNSCNTGPVQCCNSLTSSDGPVVSNLLSLLGVAVGDITGQVGLTCSPISVLGLGHGSSCSSQPVCCSNNSFNGVVALGCNPINISL
ncbi:hydrophobin [Pholiota conissans]|uniref:Hydrophobin n=1 Tax=Pholiota conissans TaxID=109636 RepID=A0A9P5Z0D8_9AGAR|nr:hydrophobin [Pholiota conissans]